MRTSVVLICLSAFVPLASAQFGEFFEQMFHGGGQQQQHRQQQQQRQQAAGGLWASTAEQIPCSQYLCPATLHCVGRPIDCPCPSPEDIKCFVPDTDGAKGADGTVVCVRGEKGCASIEKMMKP